jgi:sugar lactone lactonase YvrE
LLAVLAGALATAGCGGGGGGKHDGGGGNGGAGADGGSGAGGGNPDGGGVDGTAACPTTGTGQLVVTVTGLPTGTTPMLQVSGGGLPGPMAITPGTPVSLAAGPGYEVDYRRVKVAPAPGGIVGKAFYVSAGTFAGCIKSGEMATDTLTFAQEPGSEHMWIGVSNAPTPDNELASFASADIAATAAKSPTLWKTKNFVGRPGAGAFDASGNFWVPGGDVVNMYEMSTLATPGDAAPQVVLTQPTNSHAVFAAFDANGNLWISRGTPANTIVRYAPADQMHSGMPTPAVTITSTDLVNPAGLAFDSHGDLWVASEGNDEVVRFNRERLGASYAGAADVVITAKTAATAPVQATYTAPNGLAFDQAGDLWVGYGSNLVGLTPTQLTATALVAGPIALNVSVGSGGFAFDESGGLWCAGGGMNGMNTFQRFPKTALAATGDAAPDIVITSTDLGYAESLAPNPSPTWSPLHDAF